MTYAYIVTAMRCTEYENGARQRHVDEERIFALYASRELAEKAIYECWDIVEQSAVVKDVYRCWDAYCDRSVQHDYDEVWITKRAILEC